MNLCNRRLLLTLNNNDIDIPISSTTTSSISPLSFSPHKLPTQPTTTTNNNDNTSPPPSFQTSSLQLIRSQPIFTANVAYAFLILFTALFFIAFIFFYIRQSSADDSSVRRRSGKANSSASKPLPALPYRGGEKDCAICLEEFVEGETVKVIPYCKHVFHPECIDTWLVAHVTCPVCRCTRLCEESGGEEGRREEGLLERQGSFSERRRNSSSGITGGAPFRVVLGETVTLRRTLSY